MREFTKSMMSYTWAMSVFGVQQMFSVFEPTKAAQSFDSVTKATEEELGDALKATFRAGDNMQKGLVDVTFGVLTFGTSGRAGATATADVAQQTGEALRQGGRVVGKAVESITQTVQSATSAVTGAAKQSGGWAATPSMSRDVNAQSRKEPVPGPGPASPGAVPRGGQQGWGPMPAQGSQAPRT
ncbi:MAG: hypothetical protein H7Z16_03050 [Pyrinomonadaceae bacterium]|nr:hypothetical protein [Pyrinomonadaceae bacterium]